MPDDKSLITQLPTSDAEFRAAVAVALHAGAARMQRIEDQLAENTKLTQSNTAASQAVRDRTDEMVEVFQAMKGGFRVLGWLGAAAKIVAPIVGAYFAIRQAGLAAGWWPFH